MISKINTIFRVLAIILLILPMLSSCNALKYRPVSAKDYPPEPEKRIKKNIEEGRGISIGGLLGNDGNTNFQFASSNPMWRATLEILDFLPLANVDYSGGIISTDWYNEGTAGDESLKITVRFLTNEIRSDGIKIIIHKKKCTTKQNCVVKKISSALENELQVAILKRATIFEKDIVKKTRKKRPPKNE